MKKLIVFTLLVITHALSLSAQFYSVALPVDNVMSSHHIRSVTQDKKGFLWMASTSGLFRYDGYSYQKIRETWQPELLPNEAIQNVNNWGDRYLWIRLRGEQYSCYDVDRECFVDWSGNKTNDISYKRFVIFDDHNLWLYDNQNGCCHVTVSDDGTFSSQQFNKEDKSLPSNKIAFVNQERNGTAWIGTDSGLVRITDGKTHLSIRNKSISCSQTMDDGSICFVSEEGDIYRTQSSGSFSVFNPSAPLPDKVRRVALEHQQLILCTDGDTYCFDLMRKTLTPHPSIHIRNAQMVEDNKGNKVVFDSDGTQIWYITPRQTFHLVNIYSKELKRHHAGGRYRFIYGSQGIIWISTYGNGLFSYDTTTGEMIHHTQAGQFNALLSTNFLLNLYEDHVGRLWVCQESLGVRCISRISQHCDIRYFTTSSDLGHGNTIRMIKAVGDQLYVANMQNDLWTINENSQVIDRSVPYDDDVVAAASDQQGRLWTGTRSKGIFIDGKPMTPNIKGKVSDILCDEKGRIWISIFNGHVLMVTSQTDGTQSVRTFFQGKHAITQPRLMTKDHKGRIWLCSSKGIYMFDPDQLVKNDSAYRHINVTGIDNNSDEVHCIFEDSKHRLWAGATGYGLALIDSSGQVVRCYTDKDGLPNNNIESIIEDQKGGIWAGTGYGLAKYIEDSDRFYAFFLSNIATGQMYTEGCAALLKDGRLAFGTLHGMQLFYPDDIKSSITSFPLKLTNIQINGVSLRDMGDVSDIYQYDNEGDHLLLTHDQNSLSFFFSSFEYVNTRLTKYSYMLEGFDKQWSEPSAMNLATYKNLSPGHYTLHVRSYNINGIQGEHETTLDITIRQPWWNTWWAWVIYVVLASAAGWITWRHFRQLEDLRTKIKVENQLTEYKLRFFTNISHEFRTPLTIIRGTMDRIIQQGDIPGSLKQPINSMQKSTDRLLRLVTELLEFRKIQNQQLQLQLEETDIVGFLRNIFLTFNEKAQSHHINYQFTTFARDYKMFIDRNFVDKMAYNLLSNAFKYTPHKGEIIFRVKMEGDAVMMEVEDTGIGVAKEKQGDLFTRFNQSAFSRESIGIGLHMASELVRVHHGVISFRENPAGGSIFSITLPTDKNVYNEGDFLMTDNNLLIRQAPDTELSSSVSYQETSTPPLNDRRVLIVDDDDDMRSFIANELRHYFVTDTATSGEEALEKMHQQRPALVISDVKMPGMSGFELTKRIRQDQELSDLPVILLTAIADEDKQVRGTEYGADDYLFKPFNTKVLVAKCSTLMGQRDRLRIKYAKEVVGSAPIADIIVEDADKKFLERFDLWVYNHLQDPDMQTTDFANSMKMGRTTFFKKVKQVTGMSPHEYIRKIRFNHAAELLKDPTLSISEVSYQTGFDDPNYFSRSFKDYFGITATQFRKGKQEKE